MASTKERAFSAFEEHGPDAFTAAEWAERIDTSKDYVYQLRGDYKEQHEASEADEQASTSEDGGGAEETTDDPDPEPESLSDQSEAAEGNGTETEPSATTPEASAPATDAEADSEPSATSPDEPTRSEPKAATDGGDIVAVGHEGKEKLSPAGFEEESVSSIDPPDGTELPDDVSPEDFEPDPSASADHDPEPEPEPEPEEQDTGGGGLLSRIRGDSSASETTEEVVEDAPDQAEAERREELLGTLEGADGGPDPAGGDGDQPNTSTTSHGLVMDEDLVASMFGMPFAQAANATGWDGWELTDEEKEANARLLVAYCDEQDIDLSAGGMLAMSLMSTVGGRVAGYAQHRRSEQADEADGEPVDHDPEQADEATEETTEQTTEQTTEADGENFDFSDSSTW